MSAGAPDWVIELSGIARTMAERMESTGRVSGVEVAHREHPPTLVVIVASATQLPRETAWMVAMMVAGMWPPWLAEWDVGFEVSAAGSTWRADCELMVAVAEGAVDRPRWLLAAR